MAWTPSVVTVPKQPPKTTSKPSGKHAEKISVKSNLPVEDLLQDFLRQNFAPNSNDGNSYYTGIVMKVITSDDENLYLYDIFEDSMINQERFSNDTNKKEKQKSIKVLVHIPELFSIGDQIIVPGDTKFIDALHYASSFKVLYHGNDKISPGNYVKIVFKNNQSFKDPEIVAIYRAESKTNIVPFANDKIKKAFKSELDCRVDQLSGSEAAPSNLNLSLLSTPTIGYYQFFRTLEALLSTSGQDSFKRNYLENVSYSFSDLETTISISNKIENTVENNKIVKEKILSTPSEEYLIYIFLKHPKSQFLTEYASFIEKNITSYQFSSSGLEFNKDNTQCTIIIDVLAFKQSDGQVPSLDTYLKNSEDFKNSGVATVANQDIEIQQQNPITVTMNTTMDNCVNQAPGNVELYYDYDLKYKNFVDLLLNNKKITLPWKYATEITKVQDLFNTANLKISSEKISKGSDPSVYTFEELLKINKLFYTYPQRILKLKETKQNILNEIKANTNFSVSKNNFITEDALESRLYKISNFLYKLRNEIAKNEGIPISNVLILPTNGVRAKTMGKQDYEFSRHYFGMAVDFVVIIKFLDGETIKQIPPLVIYLYCRKVLGNERSNTGNGIYDKYNHFEYLNYQYDEEDPKSLLKGLSDDERSNGRIWVNSFQVEQDLKKINDQPIQKMDQILVNYVMKKFGSITTGQTINKIMRLL